MIDWYTPMYSIWNVDSPLQWCVYDAHTFSYFRFLSLSLSLSISEQISNRAQFSHFIRQFCHQSTFAIALLNLFTVIFVVSLSFVLSLSLWLFVFSNTSLDAWTIRSPIHNRTVWICNFSLSSVFTCPWNRRGHSLFHFDDVKLNLHLFECWNRQSV